MRYDEFVKRTKGYPIFGEEVFNTLDWSKGARKLQLGRWAKEGKVLRLKRGIYTLPDDRRALPVSIPWLANTLYSPSYISLEYVLARYDLIPEKVQAITSVTGLKTQTFINPLGRFVYRHMKRDLFFGFAEVNDEFQKKVLMATKEKALLDTIYLLDRCNPSEEFFEQNMRLQQVDQLAKKRLKEYARRFNSKRIFQAVDVLSGMI